MLAKKLGIDFYYSSNTLNKEILETFLRSTDEKLVLITTSALAIGINYSIIKFTLHLTPLYSLIDYI